MNKHVKKGINLIVGQNSAGKTALLEALTLGNLSNPHKSIHSLQQKTDAVDNRYSFFAEISFKGEELERLAKNQTTDHTMASTDNTRSAYHIMVCRGV